MIYPDNKYILCSLESKTVFSENVKYMFKYKSIQYYTSFNCDYLLAP